MEKVRFTKSEVIAYLEEMILANMASEDETELYIEYSWTGKLVKGYTYKLLVAKMKRIYEGF